MKRKFLTGAAIALGCLLFAGGIPASRASAEELVTSGKAAYACDFVSGTEVYAKNETARLPIASMCKIMTLILSFEAVEEGKLEYSEMVPVSANAAGMGGSQVFLEKGLSYPAGELMKTVAVCSANDSCVALAERIAGGEAAFVERMNARAKELGAENTLFANCTGLPKEPQYSCAKDVAAMLRALLTHEKYFEFSRVWLEDFAHPDGRTTQITNTNKLIRFYEGCDGGKTGFTNEAGFCLAATAKRQDTRLIAVVIGADNSKGRFAAVSNLFDYGFNAYENRVMLEEGKALEERLKVSGSKIKELPVAAARTLSAFVKRGEKGDFSVSLDLSAGKAPIGMGEKVGEAALYCGGVELMRTDLLAMGEAPRYTWWEAFRETARAWQ